MISVFHSQDGVVESKLMSVEKKKLSIEKLRMSWGLKWMQRQRQRPSVSLT